MAAATTMTATAKTMMATAKPMVVTAKATMMLVPTIRLAAQTIISEWDMQKIVFATM